MAMAYGNVMSSGYMRRKNPVNYNDRAGMAAEQGNTYNTVSDQGDQAAAGGLGAMQGFDASKGLNDYARGAWGNVSAGLDQTLAKLKGQAVGAGRADSGFFDQDQGTAIRGVMSDFTNNLATHALDAQGQQQHNTDAMTAFGENQQGQAADMLAARRGEVEQDARDEQERKAKKKSGIGSAIGGILGAGVGSIFPGVGTAIGAGLGSKLGGMF